MLPSAVQKTEHKGGRGLQLNANKLKGLRVYIECRRCECVRSQYFCFALLHSNARCKKAGY